MTKAKKKQAQEFVGDFSNDPETLARQIFEDHRHWGDEAAKPLIERAVALHGDGKINLFGVVTTQYFQDLAGFDFFGGQHFFCEVIPLLSGSTEQVMSLVASLVEKAGEDLAANQPNAALVKWCKNDVQRAHSIIDAAEKGDGLACRHATFALEAAEDHDTALNWLSKHDDERQLSAIAALGRMSYGNPDQGSGVLEALSELAKQENRDVVLANLLFAAMAICKSAEDFTLPALQDIVESCSELGGDQTKYQCASVLWQFGKHLPKAQVGRILDSLSNINPAHKGTLRELDHALASLFATGFPVEVTSFFEQLASNAPSAIDPEVFSSFLRVVLSADAVSVGDVLSTWLLSGNRSLCEGIAKKLGDPGLRPPEIDLSGHFSTLDEIKAIFVCRKAVGFFFFAPEVAVTFLIAAIRISNTQVRGDLADLLFDPVTLNYGGAASDALSSVSKDDEVYGIVQDVLSRFRKYRDALGAISEIKELRPTETQRQIEWQRSNEQMRLVQKMAYQKSVFFDLVSHSTLLYGRTSQIFTDGPDGKRKATEVALQQHSTTVEIPRLQIFDPVGLEYTLLVLRNEQLRS
jgi:hypothetical protein